MKRRRVLSFLAAGILLLYTPVFLSGADETYRLSGVTEAKEVPAFTLSNVWDGSFQDGLDDYVQTKLPGRPLMVRLRNSLTFSAL